MGAPLGRLRKLRGYVVTASGAQTVGKSTYIGMRMLVARDKDSVASVISETVREWRHAYHNDR